MRTSQELRQIGRLESEHLAFGIERFFNLAERGAGAGGNHELLGLIEGDA
jgi:hypothetical protein